MCFQMELSSTVSIQASHISTSTILIEFFFNMEWHYHFQTVRYFRLSMSLGALPSLDFFFVSLYS